MFKCWKIKYAICKRRHKAYLPKASNIFYPRISTTKAQRNSWSNRTKISQNKKGKHYSRMYIYVKRPRLKGGSRAVKGSSNMCRVRSICRVNLQLCDGPVLTELSSLYPQPSPKHPRVSPRPHPKFKSKPVTFPTAHSTYAFLFINTEPPVVKSVYFACAGTSVGSATVKFSIENPLNV